MAPWVPGGVSQTMRGKSDIHTPDKPTAGWARTDYSFGRYPLTGLPHTISPTRTRPRGFDTTSAIRDDDITRFWDDCAAGTAAKEVQCDPTVARRNRFAAGVTTVKGDGRLRPGEKVAWEQTTSQEALPKLDAPAVAAKTREEAARNKRVGRVASVQLQDCF